MDVGKNIEKMPINKTIKECMLLYIEFDIKIANY